MSLQTCESRENNFGRTTKPLFNQTRHETGSRKGKNKKKTITVQTGYDLDVYENTDK